MQMELLRFVEALACEKRLQVLEWLREPTRHFRRQVDGDLVKDGVCALLLAEKLGVSPSTTSRHMKQLTEAGLVRGKKIKQWTFYRRDEAAIRKLTRLLARSV